MRGAATARAEERASLRHRNTSKWVKRALDNAHGGDGGGADGADARRAVGEQLALGDALLRRKAARMSTAAETSSDESDGGGGEGAGVVGVAARSRRLLEAEAADGGGDGDGAAGATGIFK